MPVDIMLRGNLEPVRIMEEFSEAAASLQMASAKGYGFLVATDECDGEPIMISMDNILTVKAV